MPGSAVERSSSRCDGQDRLIISMTDACTVEPPLTGTPYNGQSLYNGHHISPKYYATVYKLTSL